MNPTRMFVKKWQMDSFSSKSMDDQVATMRKALDTTKDSATRAMIKMNLDRWPQQLADMKKTIMTTNMDGTFNMNVTSMGQSMDMKGKWALTADGKKVVLSDDKNPKPDTLEIQRLTGDKMTLVAPDSRGGKVYITYKAVN